MTCHAKTSWTTTPLLVLVFIWAAARQLQQPINRKRNLPSRRPTPKPFASVALNSTCESLTPPWGFADLAPNLSLYILSTDDVISKLNLSLEFPPTDDHVSRWRAAVREEFAWSWAAYEDYAWGMDECLPISKAGQNWVTGGIGLTILDSLDSLLFMGFDDEFELATHWVEQSLSFDRASSASTFELSIRALGGLLGAHALTGRPIFAERAIDLGERLLKACSARAHGPLPTTKVSLRLGAVLPNGEPLTLSEVGTLHLEFSQLSAISGDARFKRAVDRVTEHLAEAARVAKPPHLLPIFLGHHGEATDWFGQPLAKISLGAGGDSYYEYLLKVWLQSNRTDTKLWRRYESAVEAIRKRLIR